MATTRDHYFLAMLKRDLAEFEIRAWTDEGLDANTEATEAMVESVKQRVERYRLRVEQQEMVVAGRGPVAIDACGYCKQLTAFMALQDPVPPMPTQPFVYPEPEISWIEVLCSPDYQRVCHMVDEAMREIAGTTP